ncbi:MAG TPA: cytochrome b/b6 domain-containing protein [Armatimonadota bacterium]|jgi:formate dehydrogenase gamma subunit
MPQIYRRPRTWLVYALAGCTGVALLFGPRVSGQQASATPPIPRDDVKACLACHEQAMSDTVKAVNAAGLQTSPHKELKCQDCHQSITSAPHTPAMVKQKAQCVSCHGNQMAGSVMTDHPKDYAISVHARPDKVAGDHPTCVICHGGGDPHAVVAVSSLTAKDKAELCSKCHSQKDRMARYGVDPDAVSSYNESFHGKALLRFDLPNVATCTNCHHAHDVLSPKNAGASTNRANVAATCGGCHKGAKVNFAMSGANHLRLKAKESRVILWELWFFKIFVFSTLFMMILGVALDLRRKVFTRGHVPSAGKPVSVLVALGFMFTAAALAVATAGIPGARKCAIAAVVSMVLAFVVYYSRKRPVQAPTPTRTYPRLSVVLRWQHAILMTSFTMLAITGLPMRFASVSWVGSVYVLFGGLAGARGVHRFWALLMIFTAVWHIAYLLLQWKRSGFSRKNWTMLPNLQDVRDFIGVSKYYLGITHEEPAFGRYQFREKMDYMAEYWGVPVMVLSGFVMWFPIYWGNLLPESALSFAYIAHSYEATLAFLAIITWHMYNAHFNPDVFPANNVFYTGTLTEEQMRREHPLELEQLLRAENASGADKPEAKDPPSHGPDPAA